ncbi:hypothetical protein [Luteolibacter sp. Populi]|uniref:hypothetical protein n=1 Tax=Luteolibacter sp. Populi TaxID=3230487 RepID=UPI0034672D49
MKPRNHSFIPLRIPAAMVLLGSTWQVHAAFTAVDNFNTRSLGNISGQGGWLATNTTSVAVIVDPGNPINKVLRQSGDGDAGVALPAAIANATTGTYFFRMRVISTTNNTSFGLADSPLPVTTGQVGNFGSFEVQAQAINANLRGRDVATTFATPLNFQSTAWYKVWLVVNNTSDTWQMYVQSADDSGYATQTQLTPTDGTWNFRNAPASNAITTAQFTSDNGNAFLYFDDLYIDNAGVNLADPTFVADPDTDDDDLVDAWETFYFGNLAQGRNDDTENGGTGDGLTHFEEQTLGTSPLSADTDGDGLADGAEDDGMANPAFGNVRTNPLAADSDGDGASDGQETSGALNAAFANTPTDPNLSDTDGDGMPDFDETVYPSNPNDIASLPKLHALIGPAKRNGSFELLGGVTGATAEANHWDTDSDGDVDNWTLWPTVSSANGGGTDDAQSPSNGTRRTEVDVNNAAYNLSTYQVKEGDIIRVTWDHLATSSGTGNHTFWVAYDDGFGGILQFTPTATVSRAPGTASKLIYKVPAASPIIGKKIGVGVKAFANDQRIDNVVLTVVDGDSDGDELSDFWEDQNFGNNDENPTPGELVLQGKLDDPDGDTYNNLAEQAVGSNPNSAASNPGDTDGDGLADEWELTYAPDLATLTGSGDPDHDYATNEQEETGDSHPLLSVGFPDTDHDGLNDGWEKAHFTNLGTADIDSDSDGSINSLEMAAGSDPGNPASTPAKALLVHRWNFNGTLNDSAGTSHAQIVDADANPATGGGSSISATAVTLDGGLNTESDYVDLGTNLLQGKMTPVTIELWATQNTVQNWSRIFDLNNGTSNEYLMMSWSSGVNPNADSVEWKDTSITTRINSVAPYTPGTQYHIVMTILPAVHSGEAIGNGSRVVWYAAPVGSTSPLGQIQGSFDAPHHLSTFNDLHAWLGRSVFSVLPTPDSVAGATYDEVRIWDGALADVQRHVAQAAGPDAPDLVSG